MAVIETWFNQDLQQPVKVHYLDGSLFSHNGNGNRIGVHVFNNGEPVTLSGTVSGYVVTADGSTVPCTGSRSGNNASILIPAAAYQPGAVFITVFLTDGNTVTTLASVATNVLTARTNNQVSPGSVVTDWTNTINAAMQAVVDANAANMATPYASLTFPVPLGKYCLHDNLLYRCTTPIASSEDWTAGNWQRCIIADEVSDAKKTIELIGKNGTEILQSVFPNSDNAFVLIDQNGNISFAVDNNGVTKIAKIEDIKTATVDSFNEYVQNNASQIERLEHLVDVLRNTYRTELNSMLEIVDDDGNIGLKIDASGKVYTKSAVFSDVDVDDVAVKNIEYQTHDIKNNIKPIYNTEIEDEEGNILVGIEDDGSVAKIPKVNVADISIKTNLSHFIGYGQSWSVGYSVSQQPIIDTTQPYHNLMFKGGVIAYKSSLEDKYGSFVPLVEKAISGGYYETPVSGQCNMIIRALQFENGYVPTDYQIIGTAPGEGAKSLDQLKKGTVYYQNLIDAVTYAKAIADTEHKIYTVDAISWIQGTLDPSGLNQLQLDLNADIKAITGQTNDVKLLTWQYEVHNVNSDYYAAYVGIHNTNPNIVCTFPGYIIPHIDDGEGAANNIHFTSIGNVIAGEYMGIAFKRLVLEGVDWNPLIPTEAKIVGNNLIIKFNVPCPPLQIDTFYVETITNYGFQLFDQNGNEKNISVSLFGTDSVKIYCGSGVANTDQIRYAYNPQNNYDSYCKTDIARGNICDSQSLKSICGRPLRNYLVAFKKTVGDLV